MKILVVGSNLILNFLTGQSSILISISSIYQKVVFPTYNILSVQT